MVRVTFVMDQHVGLYTYFLNLRRFIDSTTGIEATWVPVTYSRPDSPWDRIPWLPPSIRGSLNGRAQAREGIARSASDVLFFNTQVPAALAHGMIRQRPYLVSTDVTPVQYDRIGGEYGHRADRAGLLKSYKHFVNTRVFRGAARILPWSRWVAGSLVADYGVDPRRIEVIPPGIDLTQWTPGSREEDGPVRILFVGGELERKGGPLLLEAFRTIRAPGVELHFITRQSLPAEPGLFVHNNMQPNSEPLRDLYRRCDLFCLPTRADCLPIALLEAAATGMPMISTNVGAIPEVVRHGETGILIEPHDLGGLVECLGSLVHDAGLRRRMGRAARQDAETRFDSRRNGRRVVELLLETAGAQADAKWMNR
jgi:glycosyltransferase involved in cell wall biosynthesis